MVINAASVEADQECALQGRCGRCVAGGLICDGARAAGERGRGRPHRAAQSWRQLDLLDAIVETARCIREACGAWHPYTADRPMAGRQATAAFEGCNLLGRVSTAGRAHPSNPLRSFHDRRCADLHADPTQNGKLLGAFRDVCSSGDAAARPRADGLLPSHIGPLNQVVHLWRYASLAEMEGSAPRATPTRTGVNSWPYRRHGPLQDNKVMRPA